MGQCWLYHSSALMTEHMSAWYLRSVCYVALVRLFAIRLCVVIRFELLKYWSINLLHPIPSLVHLHLGLHTCSLACLLRYTFASSATSTWPYQCTLVCFNLILHSCIIICIYMAPSSMQHIYISFREYFEKKSLFIHSRWWVSRTNSWRNSQASRLYLRPCSTSSPPCQ